MSTTDQAKFKNDLRELFDDTHDKMLKLAKQIEDIRGKVADGIWQNDYAEAEVEVVERKIEATRSECEAQARERIEQRLEELDTVDTLKPEEINADCELLKFDLAQRDIDELARRNSSNPTVTRLITRYAEAHNLTVPMTGSVVELASDRNETVAMREVARVALRWIGDPKRGQSVLDRLFEQVGC